MYTDVVTALETMIAMAEETECVRAWADGTPREGLDEANNFSVECDEEDNYRVTVESEGVTCVATKVNGEIVVVEGTDKDFTAFCEEFTLAW